MGLLNRWHTRANDRSPIKHAREQRASWMPLRDLPAPTDSATESSTEAAPAWQGRRLRLRFPADAEHARDHARLYVENVAELEAIYLDYSLRSLDIVDELLGRYSGIGSDAVAESIFTAGFYIGEVCVRTQGAQWVDTEGEVRDHLGMPVAFRRYDGSYWNPIGKAFKRVENGQVDSIQDFAGAALYERAARHTA